VRSFDARRGRGEGVEQLIQFLVETQLCVAEVADAVVAAAAAARAAPWPVEGRAVERLYKRRDRQSAVLREAMVC
jgi:hypothetical protein